jgi:hypothetical protein
MSIDDVLQSAIDRGDLTPLPMELPSDSQDRCVLLASEVVTLVFGPYVNAAHERRAAQLAADLESFVRKKEISISLTPRGAKKDAKDADFGILDPPGHTTWDYRSRIPSPGIRLVGRFAKVDTFVALGWWPRSVPVTWSDKLPLIDDELRWRIAMHHCETEWYKVLPDLIPVAGTEVENYVSGNFRLV